MRITLVEDNAALRKGIAFRLEDDGHSVDAIGDGAQALDFLRGEPSDVVVLDVNLPGLSGLEILRVLRAAGDARLVILLTARSQTAERIAGLDAGADDYLVKPFEMDELMARIRAAGRRRSDRMTGTHRIGRLEVDAILMRATADGTPLDLRRRELATLVALAEAGGRALSKAAILDRVYATGEAVDTSVVEVNVSRLRKRLAPLGVGIRAQRGIGYVLHAEE